MGESVPSEQKGHLCFDKARVCGLGYIMAPQSETIVLLHGIGRTPRSLTGIERRLNAANFQTINLAYPWRSMDVPQLAAFVADTLCAKEVCKQRHKLNFVTHSMGGLIAVYMLGKLRNRFPSESIGRVVMLGPPLQGSEVADALSPFPPYNRLYGPAGHDLKTTSQLLHGIIPDYPLGIIAGTMGWPYLTGLLITGSHDGRVAVSRTRIEGMTDHLVLPVTHTFMPSSSEVQKQVLYFIKYGAFKRSSYETPPAAAHTQLR